MNTPANVHIIAAPVACADGVKETWREVAQWAAQQLKVRYGTAVTVTYFDLFDPTCPPLPTAAQLPLVLVNGQMVSSGGKISLPLICRHVEAVNPPG